MADRNLHQRLIASAVALLLLGGPTALSVVDAHERHTGPTVEFSHDPGHCVYRHDHTACLHLLSSAARQTATVGLPIGGGTDYRASPGQRDDDVRSRRGAPLPPRGPPLFLG